MIGTQIAHHLAWNLDVGGNNNVSASTWYQLLWPNGMIKQALVRMAHIDICTYYTDDTTHKENIRQFRLLCTVICAELSARAPVTPSSTGAGPYR